jgi:hypothetical protein
VLRGPRDGSAQVVPDAGPDGGPAVVYEPRSATSGGRDDLVVRADDGRGGSATATVTIVREVHAAAGADAGATAPEQGGTGAGAVASSGAAGSPPPARRCGSLRRFPIHVLARRGERVRAVVVTVRGVAVRARRTGGRGWTAVVDLRGLRRTTVVARIRVTLADGRRRTARRTYHPCAPRPESSKSTNNTRR